MPTEPYEDASGSEEIEVLTFDQFVSSTSKMSDPQNRVSTEQVDKTFTSHPDTYSDVQPRPQDTPEELPFASKSRLYLMVLADFGLSFTWLCKFAVATYVFVFNYQLPFVVV